jgi:hypothetical protein
VKRPLLPALIVAALLPIDARAVEFKVFNQPLRLDITESLYLNAHLDPGDGDPTGANYGELFSRLNVQLAWKRLLFGFRIDSAMWVHTPQPGDHVDSQACASGGCTVTDGDSRLVGRFGRGADFGKPVFSWGDPDTHHGFGTIPFDPKKFFEKISLSYSGRTVDATLGDFYVSLGRGLVLSIRKVDELGVDTTLLGGKVAIHEGDFSGIAFAGWTNIQNVDEAKALYTPDPNDFIAGGHVDYRVGGVVIVGGNVMGGVPAHNKQTTNSDHDYYLRYSITFDAPHLTKWLALYAEYARADDRVTDVQ